MYETLQPQHCARMLRCLADPERLRIIDCLRAGPKNVGELADVLEAVIVNTSHHLGVLKKADLVLDEKHGRYVVYRLNPAVYRPADAAADCDHLDFGCCRLELRKV